MVNSDRYLFAHLDTSTDRRGPYTHTVICKVQFTELGLVNIEFFSDIEKEPAGFFAAARNGKATVTATISFPTGVGVAKPAVLWLKVIMLFYPSHILERLE